MAHRCRPRFLPDPRLRPRLFPLSPLAAWLCFLGPLAAWLCFLVPMPRRGFLPIPLLEYGLGFFDFLQRRGHAGTEPLAGELLLQTLEAFPCFALVPGGPQLGEPIRLALAGRLLTGALRLLLLLAHPLLFRTLECRQPRGLLPLGDFRLPCQPFLFYAPKRGFALGPLPLCLRLLRQPFLFRALDGRLALSLLSLEFGSSPLLFRALASRLLLEALALGLGRFRTFASGLLLEALVLGLGRFCTLPRSLLFGFFPLSFRLPLPCSFCKLRQTLLFGTSDSSLAFGLLPCFFGGLCFTLGARLGLALGLLACFLGGLLLSSAFESLQTSLCGVGQDRRRVPPDEIPQCCLVAGILDSVPSSLLLARRAGRRRRFARIDRCQPRPVGRIWEWRRGVLLHHQGQLGATLPGEFVIKPVRVLGEVGVPDAYGVSRRRAVGEFVD